MLTSRIVSRPPRPPHDAPEIATDTESLKAVLEDAAHYAGGHAVGVALPRTEGEVAALLQRHSRVLPIGAQSSLTGGATPRGDLVLSTARLSAVLDVTRSAVRVQAGVSLAALQETLGAADLYYPPAPTHNGAFVGGTIATNAAGAATFKYGSTRRWVRAVTVVLASGEVLDIERGRVVADPDGCFEIEGPPGIRRVKVPSYRMPDVPKCSAGYFAAPGMDLIDLFIGSEGTLGVVVEATLEVVPAVPTTAAALIQCATERDSLRLVSTLRDASQETWRSGDPCGIDVSAIEHLDRRCIELLREDGAGEKNGVTFGRDTAMAVLVQLELPPGTTPERAFDEIALALDPSPPDTALARFCRLLDRAGVLDQTEMALPGDRRRAEQFAAVREAVPTAVNQRIAMAKRTVDPAIEKTAADMIAPFARFGEIVCQCQEGFVRRGLDFAIWGHVSDGNLHANVIPRSLEEMRAGREAILELGHAVIEAGGSPLAEHGVGRSPVKQALMRQLYGDEGVDEMCRVKAVLDPEWKLSPGVLLPVPE
jgi:D-lactate dehydrogenase (cytochrome)